MTNNLNIKIKIPNAWYAGFQKTRGSGLPTVIMTPNGTDKASSSRIATIKRYSYGDKGIPDAVMDNKPLCGFKIVKPSTSYNSNKIVWLIEDPRGFMSEIPSGNMGQLLALTTVDHCEILESCVWARDGKDNVLLPTNSIEYQTAVKNTELSKQTININKVQLGNIVHLKNGKRNMKYLGKYYAYTGHERRYGSDKPKIAKAEHYYIDLDDVIHSYGNGNVAELVDATSMLTPAEAEEFINSKVSKILMSVEPKIGINTSIDLIPLDVPSLAIKYANTVGYEPYDNVVVVKMPGNVMAYCDYPHFGRGYHGKHELEFREIVQADWVQGFLIYRTKKEKSNWGGWHETHLHHTIDLNNLSDDLEFYEVEFTWQTPHGEFKKKSKR